MPGLTAPGAIIKMERRFGIGSDEPAGIKIRIPPISRRRSWTTLMDQVKSPRYMNRMTIQMNIAEAKAKLSELVARAEAGEEVVIARDGKPVVVLTPQTPAASAGARRLGVWDHFGAELPEALFLQPDRDSEAAVLAWEAAPINPSE